MSIERDILIGQQIRRKREECFGHIGSANCFCEHCKSIRDDTICNCGHCRRVRTEQLQHLTDERTGAL